MNIKKRAEYLLSRFNKKDKEEILSFLMEAQLLEYGLLYLLTGIPYSKHKIEDFSKIPLGRLINEIENLKDPYFSDIISEAKDFNRLRIEIIHYLIHSDKEPRELISEIREKIKLAQNTRNRIEHHFDFVYELLLGMPYGPIF